MKTRPLASDDRALIRSSPVEKRWEVNSPDLNTADYSIWRAFQRLIYRRRRFRDVEHLKEVLQTCWEQIGQDVIDRAMTVSRTIIAHCYNRRMTH